MSLTIVIYEDNKFADFYPLSCLRPVYTLRPGILPLFKQPGKLIPHSTTILSCRTKLAPLLGQQFNEIPVNIIKKSDGNMLFLNGRIKNYGDLFDQLQSRESSSIFKSNDDEIICLFFPKEAIKYIPAVASIENYVQYFRDNLTDFGNVKTTATMYNRNWEIMDDIEAKINDDFEFIGFFGTKSEFTIPPIILNSDQVHIGENVKSNPAVVIDATGGPVYIDDNVELDSFAAIYGPCYIGKNCRILRGKISSSSVGEGCRIGGEVESTVFQAHVNKYHDGFMGHGYVGSWVNFGAMTTNSDLKNNYTNIRTRLNGKGIDTNSNKVGSFIGDHTKFGIGTLLNTGINIGICCNLFGGTLITDKEVKPFSWGQSGNYKVYDVEKAIETAKIVAGRRNLTLSDFESALIRAMAEGEVDNDGCVDWYE